MYAAALSPANIQNAFKRCGIYPYNPAVISDSVIAPSLSFKCPEAEEAQCTASSAADPIPQPDQPNYDQVVRSFLDKRGGELLKKVKLAKIMKTLSKLGCKDQESMQSSNTPDPGYQWESDKLTVRHHKRETRDQPFPSR